MGWTSGVHFLVGAGAGAGAGKGFSLFATASRLGLGPIQPPIQWVMEPLTLMCQSGLSMKLTTHLHLLQRLRTRGAEPPFIHMSSWHAIALIYVVSTKRTSEWSLVFRLSDYNFVCISHFSHLTEINLRKRIMFIFMSIRTSFKK
jgi:hypothetical protein